jgi:hypothetical protein
VNTHSATGTHEIGHTPTLTISGGAGNTDSPEVHLQFRESDDNSIRSLFGWFDAEALIRDIAAASGLDVSVAAAA